LVAWTFYANEKKWTPFWQMISVFGVFCIAYHSISISAIWIPEFVGANLSAAFKIPMAGMSFIVAVVVAVTIPQTRLNNIVLPKARKQNAQALIHKQQRLNDEHNKSIQRTQELYLELRHRASDILYSLRMIISNTPADNRTLSKICCHIYQITRSQNVLVKNNWYGVSLRDCLEDQLESFGLSEDVTLSGPDVMLTAHHTLYLYMAIFELCLNSLWQAQKSQRGSKYKIQWSIAPRGDTQTLDFRWRETTKIALDDKIRGAYNVILESIVPTAFSGTGKLAYTSTAIDWRLTGLLTVGHSSETAIRHDQDIEALPRVLRRGL